MVRGRNRPRSPGRPRTIPPDGSTRLETTGALAAGVLGLGGTTSAAAASNYDTHEHHDTAPAPGVQVERNAPVVPNGRYGFGPVRRPESNAGS
ncbi:hypothetical protein BRC90_10345 [Halobacteriales archaeon QS_4_69_34]|nr:MAG: hypothetical protein BRC90_10345 [Halobacteriales archaeon QS_4_69_34]